MYLTKRKLISAYNKGLLDEVATQCRRYGNILQHKDFEVEEGHHAGAHRVFVIVHHGLVWEIAMHNGEVKRVGYTL